MDERLFMLCRDMGTDTVSVAREVVSPLLGGERVSVFHRYGCLQRDTFYLMTRKDRTFPGYGRPDRKPVGKLGDPWTLATWSEVVALRLAGQITKVECRPDVETGE